MKIAFEQFILQPFKSKKLSSSGSTDLIIQKNEDQIIIENDKVKLILHHSSGAIESWIYNGIEITGNPVQPNFWRPPTDNDLGNGMHNWAKVWQNATKNYRSSLLKLPYNSENGVSYEVKYEFPDNIALLLISYTLTMDGALKVEYKFSPQEENLPVIPRLGLSLILPNAFEKVSWYGRGPHETYWDRKTSGKLGIYNDLIINQFHRYPRPQETGNKSDVRWVSLYSGQVKLTAYSIDNKLLNTSVWPFTSSELEFQPGKAGGESASGLVPVTSRHGADIQTGDVVQWNIDHLQMGVGGDTSWGRMVHKQYTIPSKNYNFSFIIIPEIKLDGKLVI